MKFDINDKIRGEKVIIQLSEKAQKYYSETSPLNVYQTVEGEIYVDSCGRTDKYDSVESLDADFCCLYDETNSLSVEEYADQNGYGSENECLVALVREWSNCNYTDTENDFFAGKLIEMFEESGEWNFEEFISKPETMEQLFSKENGMENLKKCTAKEIEELAENLDWGNPHDDPEDIKECLRTNWEEQMDEESVEAVYEAMCRIWDENHIWYAVQNDPEDTDWGTGAYTYKEALAMAKRYKEKYGFARIVKIEKDPKPVAVEEEIL